jgi:protein involved in polysaccharide export with SLBB domain
MTTRWPVGVAIRRPAGHIVVVRIVLLALLVASRAAFAADAVGPSPTTVSDDYHVGPHDVLSVQVFGEPQLSGVFPIGPDGTVDLAVLKHVYVTGLTLPEVGKRLTDLYGERYLQNPYITVQIDTFGAYQVTVVGEVKGPGAYSLSGPTTLLDAITKAGGLVDQDIKEIHVNRDGADNVVPYADLISGMVPFVLRPGDVISVPRPQKVYINGQVKSPGAVAFSDGLTVSRALTLAGDVSSSARLSGIYVLRKGERIKVNLARIRNSKVPDLLLLADDQIVVPESAFK